MVNDGAEDPGSDTTTIPSFTPPPPTPCAMSKGAGYLWSVEIHGTMDDNYGVEWLRSRTCPDCPAGWALRRGTDPMPADVDPWPTDAPQLPHPPFPRDPKDRA